MSVRTVGVLGGGPWGIGLATAAKAAGNPVLLCSRRDPELRVEGLETTADPRQLGARCTLVLFAVPSGVARAAAASLGDAVDGSHLIVHAVRGLSDEGLLPLSEIVRQETPVRRVGALTGPVLADELLKSEPAAMVTASRYPEVVDAVQQALGSPSLRISQSSDLVGLEWASALVGALMVGIGFARGLGVSPGLLAGLMTRGVHEAARIGVAAGGEEATFFGIGGFGDLMAAMSQPRPEVDFGRMLAGGMSASDASRKLAMRIEAVDLVPRVLSFAGERGLGVPVFEALDAALAGRADKERLLAELMAHR